MDSNICFEMRLIVVDAIRGRCGSFIVLTATVSEIFGGQTNSSIVLVQMGQHASTAPFCLLCFVWQQYLDTAIHWRDTM